ncbi:hypothetical protein M409DRAFT_68820 [Zasmidium cellare ATCC 36951]|uniref:SGNH hydrolase-type esterase domain-containing protein n=1 Tax=Zasmidium cellare ATCC 36951 TaxID=1080233 RepID=A0A6A6C6T1_ZASCE|nr:uncharacterized protein M409DRAFT_68820 [Zasmidium cellare ATCC 36951]KAF2162824.1 hypothetical protein M409DRAFT_68820 [Zasmidium cellare ATCC 36951]
MDQFLLLGDSITQQSFCQDRGFGLGAALSDAYVRRLDVVNRGLSGYNTRMALQVLPQVIPPPEQAKLRFVTFLFGSNDARLPNTPPDVPQQHVPLEEYKKNMRALVTHPKILAHQGVRRILITPPPIDERRCGENDFVHDIPVRKAKDTAKYAQAVRELGKELGLQVLDLWTAMIHRAGGKESDSEPVGSIDVPLHEVLRSFVRDGLHLSPEGYRVLFDELLALIERVWPDQMPVKLPFVLPQWLDQKAWDSYPSL